jgi:hypothetical protein
MISLDPTLLNVHWPSPTSNAHIIDLVFPGLPTQGNPCQGLYYNIYGGCLPIHSQTKTLLRSFLGQVPFLTRNTYHTGLPTQGNPAKVCITIFYGVAYPSIAKQNLMWHIHSEPFSSWLSSKKPPPTKVFITIFMGLPTLL